MASRPRKIAAAEWDSHKDTILYLRQSGVSIKGENGIVARMEKDCEFAATSAQYELQLGKWGARKNITADEWRRTLQVVDQYNEDGLKCAVYKNGELVRPLTLRKKRNQHCKGQEYAMLRRSRAAVLPECVEIKISESQPSVAGMLDVNGDEDGGENALSSRPYNLAMTTSETTPVAEDSHVGAVGGFGMGESYIGSQMPVAEPFLEQSNQTIDAMSVLANENEEVEPSTFNTTSEIPSEALPLAMDHVPMDHDSTLDMVSLVRGNPESIDTSLTGLDAPFNTVINQELVSWWNSNMQSPFFNENLETRVGAKAIKSLTTLTLALIALYYIWLKSELTDAVGSQSLGASPELATQQAIVHRRSNSLASRVAEESGGSIANLLVTDTRPLGLHGSPMNSDDALLVVESIGLRLSSLLLSDAVSSNFLLYSRTAARHQTFGDSIYGSLILSVENNFAGLDNIPTGAILKFLEQGPQMRSQLSKYLRALPKPFSKAVAKNLIRAAIENCDAAMVSELLRTELVAPNDIVCSVDGCRYTAVERSATLNSIEVTKVLLTAGADINKDYKMDPGLGKGALICTLRYWGHNSPGHMQMVDMLLDHGAEVRVEHADIAVHMQDPTLIKAIMPRISPYDHPDAFRSNHQNDRSVMEDAVTLLDSDLATTIIVQIVQACYQTNCGKCSEDYSESFQKSITLAATRGYSRLVVFLVDYVADKGPPLAGAVRSGKRDIIELLLEKGANPDAPECRIDEADIFFTTPFAEAIRAGDDELIRRFHGLGATTQMSEGRRFEAAIYAASEAGKLAYVNELLRMAQSKYGIYLNLSLRISIKNGREEVALTLLKAGADVNSGFSMLETQVLDPLKPALIEALHLKNKTLVLKIMECDIAIRSEGYHYHSPMEVAALWGDISIVKDLLWMGADINARSGNAVMFAVRAKNRPLVEFFVENGARLDQTVDVDVMGHSPLTAAIENEDIDMMQYLLALGADPSRYSVIYEALEKGGEVLAMIKNAIRIKVPKSQKGLGAGALRFAIGKADFELIDILLEAKFDVNAISYGKISALGMAIEKYGGCNLHLIKKLISAGGDPNSVVSLSDTWPPSTVEPRRTAMLQAILTKSKPLVELLIDEGADIKRAARLGLKRTPLQQACEVGAMELVDLFLEKGVDVNEAPALRGGGTALQLCAIKGYCGLAEKLLELGADVHALPSEVNGRTALDGAAEYGRLDMLVLLWNAMGDKRFSPEQCSHAMKLAEGNGHFACRDLIRQLEITSRPFLEQGRLRT